MERREKNRIGTEERDRKGKRREGNCKTKRQGKREKIKKRGGKRVQENQC